MNNSSSQSDPDAATLCCFMRYALHKHFLTHWSEGVNVYTAQVVNAITPRVKHWNFTF